MGTVPIRFLMSGRAGFTLLAAAAVSAWLMPTTIAAPQEWPVYRDPKGRFEFRYPPEFGAPERGTGDGFRDRVAAVRFGALSGLGGEAALTKGRVLVDIQAVGGLHDDISMQVFPDALRARIEPHVTPLTLENFCANLGLQDHLPPNLPFEPTLVEMIRSVDRTRNEDPKVVLCARSGPVITFHKEATFTAGVVRARQQLYGAIRFLPEPYSSFQFVRGALIAPAPGDLDTMTRLVQSFAVR
jgi:hypothetical protein